MADKYAKADPYLCATTDSGRPVPRVVSQVLCVTLLKIEQMIAAQTLDVVKSLGDDLVTRGG
jgi:hypothetical protein